MRLLRALGRVFVVIGLTLLLFVVYEVFGTSIVTHRHQEALAREFDGQIQTAENPVVGSSSKQSQPPREGRALARIKIPRLGVNVIVVEGTTLGDLARGPGHYRATPLPWQTGTTAIAGHRTGWGAPFSDVDRLRAGDGVILETTHGTFRYRVTGSIVVEPGDAWVLGGDPKSRAAARLTLTTCTPKYTSLRRLIVWADRVPAA